MAWGYNDYGQLGDGTMNNQSMSELVLSNVVAAAAGSQHSLFAKGDGTLWAVGYNASGQLGDGTAITRSNAVAVLGGSNVVTVAAGYYHSLFVKSDGTLWAMGDNSYGQLGDGTTTSRYSAVCVASNVVAAAAGSYCSLSLKSDGTLWAMGDNSNGQLGDGTTITRTNAVCVASNVVAAAAGTVHSLFVKGDGTLWAMGYNITGQLGDGTQTDRHSPVCVASNVVAAAGGTYHSVFLKNNGTLWAMGANFFGQLGDGTLTGQTSPECVASNVVTLAAGDFDSLFVKSDGTLWAMGYNQYGELGDGTTMLRTSPVPIYSMLLANIVSGESALHSLAIGLPLPPVITSQPTNQTTMAGSNITFTVAASGVGVLNYQWQFNGTNLSGATATNCSLTGVTTVSAGSYTVTVTSSSGSLTSSVAILTVNLATPSVTAWPTATAIVYGQTLAASTLNGGSASVPGSFAFTTPTTAAGAGINSQAITFAPTDTTYYNPVSGSVSVTVNPATPSVITWPTATAITYGQTLAASTLSGGSASVPGSFAFATPSTASGAGAASQAITFTPTDTTDYNTVSGSTSVTISKATPTVTTWPSAQAITYGQTLASATLSGGSASVPGSFIFTTPTTAPGAGTVSQSVTFSPTDTTDYSSLITSVNVTVNQASQTITFSELATQTYGNPAFTLGATVDSGLPMNYASSDPTVASVSGATVTILKAGATIITASQPGNANYSAATSIPQSLMVQTVRTAFSGLTSLTNSYGVTNLLLSGVVSVAGSFYPASGEPVAAVINGVTNAGTVIDSTGDFVINYNDPSLAALGTNVYFITYNYPGNTDLAAATDSSSSLTLNQATPVITWNNPADITYPAALGNAQLNATASNYYLETVPGSFSYSPVSGTTLDAGNGRTLTVTFTPLDTTNYTSVTTNVLINIDQAAPAITGTSSATVNYGTTSLTLTGKVSATGPAYPPNGEPVMATINSVVVSGTVIDGTGDFSITYNDPSLATDGVGGPPYTITYNYAGNTDLTAATDTSTTLTITQATPTVTIWPTAQAITDGQTLASATLSGGSASVPGSFTFITPTTAPGAGTASQGITFTPSDTTDYSSISTSVNVTVNQASQTITFGALATQTYGNPTFTLGATVDSRLPVSYASSDPTVASVSGATVTILKAGATTITASQPGNANYSAATSVPQSLMVQTVTTSFSGLTSLTNSYGVTNLLLSGVVSVAGSFYPASGEPVTAIINGVINSGTIIDSTGDFIINYNDPSLAVLGTNVYFITYSYPGNTDLAAATDGSTLLTITQATPVITWNNLTDITFPTALGDAQLNATATNYYLETVSGSFSYSPLSGTMLGAGNGQTLTVTFTPLDTTNYTSVTTNVLINVDQAAPAITGTSSATVNYGTTSLTLTGKVSATGPAYPPIGEIVTATINSVIVSGLVIDNTGDFSIIFSDPSLATDGVGSSPYTISYNYAGNTDLAAANESSTKLRVRQATPSVIAWPTATSINFGQTLANSTLDGGSASVLGSFAFSTPVTTPGGGITAQEVTFVPTDTDDNNAVSGFVNVTVNPVASAMAINSSANPCGYRDNINFNVSFASPNVTGTVQFTVNGVVFDSEMLVDGAATSATSSAMPRGTNLVAAIYSGDGDYLPETNILQQVTTNHPPQTVPATYTLTAVPNYKILIADLATNWSDADGDTVTLLKVNTSTNGASVTISGRYVYYSNTNQVDDQFSYMISDGQGGAGPGIVNLLRSSGNNDGNQTANITGLTRNTDGSLTIGFAGIPGYTYWVEAATNLGQPEWTLISTNVAGTNGLWKYTDADAASFPVRYYRTFKP